ncbi:hypothetical protein AK33_06650 [Mannheimia granulomatis]|uniref:Uncharacterized protein n=1 Tax=Mannheimia granulomatis TaxID=85402 RepID=A0A011P7H0_9PAST|nr:hypothetical protein AK33_06650 [Mannheimia granulomatis]
MNASKNCKKIEKYYRLLCFYAALRFFIQFHTALLKK